MLLVAVLMGLNSVMTFEKPEDKLPPVNLPQAGQKNGIGQSSVKPVSITVQKTGAGGRRSFYYNERQMTLPELVAALKKNKVRTVVLRADRDIHFPWQEFCDLTWQFTESGVKQVSYATIAANT